MMSNDELLAKITSVTDRPDVIGLIYELRNEWISEVVKALRPIEADMSGGPRVSAVEKIRELRRMLEAGRIE